MRKWGFEEDQITEAINQATASPSYWSRKTEPAGGAEGWKNSMFLYLILLLYKLLGDIIADLKL